MKRNLFRINTGSKRLDSIVALIAVVLAFFMVWATAFLLLQMVPVVIGKLERIFRPQQIGEALLLIAFACSLAVIFFIFKKK